MTKINWEKKNKEEKVRKYDAQHGRPVPSYLKKTNKLRYKRMRSKFGGTCSQCERTFVAGTWIRFYGKNLVTHYHCKLVRTTK